MEVDYESIKKKVLVLIKRPYFGSVFYSTFFTMSPKSKGKFTDILSQANVIGKIVAAVIKGKLSSKDERKMREKHELHKVTEKEYNRFMKAMIITINAFNILNNNELTLDEIAGFIRRAFEKLRDQIVLFKGSESTE